MSQTGSLLKTGLAALIPLFIVFFISSVQAAETLKSVAKPVDKACLQCHKATPMQGVHGHAVSPNTLGEVNCTSCHGRISRSHRAGAKDVMRYNQDTYSVSDQNGVCLSCHEPGKLRESFWPHDVHATKIACSNCHVLHPAVDPMAGLSKDSSARIKLCVDCHSNIHQEIQKKEKP